ncbi:MAG: hypothetical protein GC145_00455 [Caulobacter sp.]|nr:hypothetical protein [Caulobacter sp.]
MPAARTSSKRYILIFAGAFVLVTLLVLVLNVIGFATGLVNPSQKRLLALRDAEMAQGGPVDVVFVGDSSLARSIDETAFEAATGLKVRSYPLTAAFGYGGTYNMLRKAVAADHPTTVVIMQTVRTAAEPQSYAGYILSREGQPEVIAWPDLIKSYLSVPNAIATVQNAVTGGLSQSRGPTAAELAVYKSRRKDATRIVSDEAALSKLSAHDKLAKQFLFRGEMKLTWREDPQTLAWIDRIAAFCDEARIRCIWAHGPLFERYCQTSGDYIARLNDAISRRGLALGETAPYCLGVDEVDDLPEHPARRRSADITRWFAAAFEQRHLLPAARKGDGALTPSAR